MQPVTTLTPPTTNTHIMRHPSSVRAAVKLPGDDSKVIDLLNSIGIKARRNKYGALLIINGLRPFDPPVPLQSLQWVVWYPDSEVLTVIDGPAFMRMFMQEPPY